MIHPFLINQYKYLSKINKYSEYRIDEYNGIKGVKLFKELIPESGFFAIVDFTGIKKVLKLKRSITEEEFYKYLYQKTGIKYIMGKSFGWTNEKEFVGRINFGESEEILIKTFLSLHDFIENELTQ